MSKTANISNTPRLCPTCGTRAGAAATKCLVCGADLSAAAPTQSRSGTPTTSGRALALRGPSGVLILVIILLLLILGLGFLAVASGMWSWTPLKEPTATITATFTPLPSFTATATPTETPVPTATSLLVEYVVKQGDQCGVIAANFNVSVESIIALNHLDPNCLVAVGKKILVPQPTPTPTALPTATLPPSLATLPPPITHTVISGETCGGIAKGFRISVNDLIAANGLKADCTIRPGQVLIIPFTLPEGPTPTASPAPPYPAPKLLVPADGGQFLKPEDKTVTLQWASVGELLPNEAYLVYAEDITCRCARTYQQAVTETRLILPESFRPADAAPHLFRWHVTTVRQRNPGTGEEPLYDPAGATSPDWGFIWSGLSP